MAPLRTPSEAIVAVVATPADSAGRDALAPQITRLAVDLNPRSSHGAHRNTSAVLVGGYARQSVDRVTPVRLCPTRTASSEACAPRRFSGVPSRTRTRAYLRGSFRRSLFLRKMRQQRVYSRSEHLLCESTDRYQIDDGDLL